MVLCISACMCWRLCVCKEVIEDKKGRLIAKMGLLDVVFHDTGNYFTVSSLSLLKFMSMRKLAILLGG